VSIRTVPDDTKIGLVFTLILFQAIAPSLCVVNPVLIKFPVPSGMRRDRLKIIHFMSNGKDYDVLYPSFDNRGWACFTITHFSTFAFVESDAKNDSKANDSKEKDKDEKKQETVYIDYDTFKSELPSHSVLAMNSADLTDFKDMKVHALSNDVAANQKKLADYYASQMGKKANVLISYGVYSRSDLPLNENGAKKILTWNNLATKAAGPIYAVCYNQTDGAYLISGNVNGNGTAAFNDFVMRDATNVTVFTME